MGVMNHFTVLDFLARFLIVIDAGFLQRTKRPELLRWQFEALARQLSFQFTQCGFRL